MPKPNDAVVAELAARCDALAQEIAQDVSGLSPILLLDRAWWSKIPERFPETEADGLISLATLFEEDTARIRRIEYLQCLIASVPTQPSLLEDIPTEAWQALLEKISTFFEAQLEYAKAAYGQEHEERSGTYVPQLKLLLASRWIMVHGKRFPVHWRPFYLDTLLPFDSLFREVYGVSALHIVSELMKIHHRDTYQVFDAIRYQNALEDIVEASDDSPVSEEERHSALAELNQSKKMMRDFEFFDLTEACHLPDELLEDLTWRSGGCTDFYAGERMQGWLLKRWPTHERPLIEIQGRRYCYDNHVLSDRVFPTLRRSIRSRSEQLATRWDETQGQLAEDLAFGYLSRLVPGGRVTRNVHYNWQGSGYECDGVVVVGRLLIIVEVKGRKVAEVPPALMFDEFLESALKVIEEPVRQGKRLREAVRERGEVNLFDSAVRRERRSLGQLRAADFDRIYVVSVTLESVSEISTQIHRMGEIADAVGDVPTWSVSVDDLRVCADVFWDSDVFVHYLHERVRMARIPELAVIDEMDFMGLYMVDSSAGRNLKTLINDAGAELLIGTSASLVIYQYFTSVGPDGNLVPMEVPEMPGLVGHMWRVVVGSDGDQGALKGLLLDLGAEWQERLGDAIEIEWLRRRAEGVLDQYLLTESSVGQQSFVGAMARQVETNPSREGGQKRLSRLGVTKRGSCWSYV